MAKGPVSIQAWDDVFGHADATDCSDSVAVARVMLNWLKVKNQYAHCAYCREQSVANAFVAYARMLHAAGVTP